MARPLTVFISDLHLTDLLGRPRVPWEVSFERFWSRIAAARGEQPARLVIVGDFFDLVRSPSWFATPLRPYHEVSPWVAKVVEQIIDATLAREANFFQAIRSRVQSGALELHYLLGNHDRLLAQAPRARRAVWRALTGRDQTVDFPRELIFPDLGVLAYHGHDGDPICSERDGSAPISDAFGVELIVRFPDALRAASDFDDPHLDDIDDVRPIYAVPAWIRGLQGWRPGVAGPAAKVWRGLVSDFLDNDFTQEWVGKQRKIGRINPGTNLQLLLQLSTGRLLAKASDKRLTEIFRYLQTAFDGRFQERAAEHLSSQRYRGLRYVINGHSHFPAMSPLGSIDGARCAYFNTGTWRTVHQIGTKTAGRPSFLPYDAMSYVAFFPDDDPLGRDFEWWTGAMVPRVEGHA